MSHRSTILAALLLVTSPALATSHALLVGSSHYPNLGERWQLDGPPHDVELLAETLTAGGFGLDADHIVELAGWPDDEAVRPTRANIEAAFERLAKIAERGDQVLVLLAGHGSQQPANADPKNEDPEPDGMDEIYLPADVAGWNGETGQVENAIVDDEIRVWLTDIRNKGAFVWMLIDACHSGTMTRGGGERLRSLPPSALGIPADAFRATGERSRGAAREEANLGLAKDAGGLVAMYAAQPDETTPERVMPWPDGRYHGLFTYTVAEVLRESRTPLTYRELAADVATRYRGMGRTNPTPLLEGGGLDREVLGLEEWPDRPRLRLGGPVEGQPGRYRLEAGDLLGLTVGSVLSVFPPAGDESPDRVLGQLRVVEVEATTSTVERVAGEDGAWKPVKEEETLPAGARCAVSWVDYGSLHMTVALQVPATAGGGPEGEPVEYRVAAGGAGPSAVEQALGQALGSSTLAERVATEEEADWFVRTVGGEVVLVPASGYSDPGRTGAEVPPAFRLGTADDPAALGRQLASSLQRIARAHHLLGLETTPGFGDVEEVEVEVRLRRFDGPRDQVGEVVEYGPAGRILRPGDHIAFEIVNPTRQDVDVTLLFVDSSYEIRALFPSAGATNRIAPGGSIFPIYRTRVSADPLGEESVVALAVRGEGQTRSFVSLEQPGLERAAKSRGAGHTSPLDQLLDTALYGEGTTRGLGAAEAADYAITVLPWITRVD